MKWTRRNILILWGNIIYSVFGFLLPIAGIIGIVGLLRAETIDFYFAMAVCIGCAIWIVIAMGLGSRYAELYMSILEKILPKDTK